MTNETTVISAAGPEDLIATVWFNLGYKPRDSLVLVGLEGPRQRVGVMIRADLPVPGIPVAGSVAALPAMVRDLLRTIAASPARGVVAVVMADRALDRQPPPVVRTLRHEVPKARLRLVDVLGVTPTAFGSLVCRDPRCCPPGGRSLEQVLTSRSALVHVLHGETVAESEAEAVADVESAHQSRHFIPSVGPFEGLSPQARWLHWEDWRQACVRAKRVPNPDPPLPGFSAALHDADLRDAVLLGLLGASDQEVRALLAGTDGWAGDPLEELDSLEELGSRDPLDAGPGPEVEPGPGAGRSDRAGPGLLGLRLARLLREPPDDERLSAGRVVLAGAARVAGPGDRGPALALLAVLAWFEGRGVRSRLLVERARADAPSVSLIGLVEDLLSRRVPPPWVRNGPEG